MEYNKKMRCSAVAATTATLVPATDDNLKGDLSDTIVNVVVTFTTARDTNMFDVTNRNFQVRINRL